MIAAFAPPWGFDRARLLRREKIEPDSPTGKRIAALLPAAENRLRALCRVEGFYALPAPGEAHELCCAVTLGAGAGEAVRLAEKEDSMLAAYLTNALADELLFTFSEALCRRLRAEFPAVGTPLFPGTELPLARQREILELFHRDGKLVDITLTDGCMLVPEKTMLWLFSDVRSAEDATPCRRCPRTDCPQRDEA